MLLNSAVLSDSALLIGQLIYCWRYFRERPAKIFSEPANSEKLRLEEEVKNDTLADRKLDLKTASKQKPNSSFSCAVSIRTINDVQVDLRT